MYRMMFCEVVLLIVFGSCLASATHNYEPLKYSVPEPLIQAFRPRGLKVSIPHTTGIQLFAFHGNINKPLHGILAGQLSQDIRRREGDRWIFYDPTVELEIGDKIYYWLFIIRDNLGYRYDNGVYEVKGSTFVPSTVNNNNSHTTYHERTPQSPISKKFDLDPNLCEKMVSNLTQTLLNLQYKIDSLYETNLILRDLVEKYVNNNTATTLTLEGPLPGDDELYPIVQSVIREKLGLAIRVLSVEKKKDGRVDFQVATLDDKIAIIKAAKEKLDQSWFSIF